MATITELGYIGVEASDFDAWEQFAVGLLGFELGARTPERMTLRMDSAVHRVLIEKGAGGDLLYTGYECASKDDLNSIATALQEAGHPVEPGSAELAADRAVQHITVSTDPEGNRVELYVGLAQGDPFESGVMVGSFLTDPGGAGHLFLRTMDKRQEMLDYYAILGFLLSDYIVQEVAPGMTIDAAFTHCNGRHHTLAFAALPVPGRAHHFMVEVENINDVGLAYDRLLSAGAPIEMTLGMHPNDRMFSFYVRTPSMISIEYGWGGLLIDDAQWEVVTHDRLSTWGHKPPAMAAAALSAIPGPPGAPPQ